MRRDREKYKIIIANVKKTLYESEEIEGLRDATVLLMRVREQYKDDFVAASVVGFTSNTPYRKWMWSNRLRKWRVMI